MATDKTRSPMSILIIVVLAVASIIYNLGPGLISSGITLLIFGIVFLLLFFVKWIQDPVTLIAGWMLTFFGLSYQLTSLDFFQDWEHGETMRDPVILFCLGLAFVLINLTLGAERLAKISGKNALFIAGALMLIVASLWAVERMVGEQKLWDFVVPSIPSIVALYYIIDWRRSVKAAKEQ
jgi:hypothetical protein